MTVAKPLRIKDRACLELWIETGNLTEAYRTHIAREPDSPHVRQRASDWASQPHIKDAVNKARSAVIEVQFGDAKGLLVEQVRRLDKIYNLGIKISPEGTPNSLPAALGATVAMSRLFADSPMSGMTKLQLLKLWGEIKGDLDLPYAAKEAVTRSILAGEAI
ncbi:hypothetical protein [Aeromonas sp. PrichA-15]|uniref:hypothetical protein n=1 Tax=Aeromonas TaxID=642 RepID=UPI001B3408D7|nr:hypothetical protein [Aeromonas sp. PrichA-15]MBP4031336.1 hypothetical protein [Aeromonas sp. PrichA-15]